MEFLVFNEIVHDGEHDIGVNITFFLASSTVIMFTENYLVAVVFERFV